MQQDPVDTAHPPCSLRETTASTELANQSILRAEISLLASIIVKCYFLSSLWLVCSYSSSWCCIPVDELGTLMLYMFFWVRERESLPASVCPCKTTCLMAGQHPKQQFMVQHSLVSHQHPFLTQPPEVMEALSKVHLGSPLLGWHLCSSKVVGSFAIDLPGERLHHHCLVLVLSRSACVKLLVACVSCDCTLSFLCRMQ